ncbi:helix-turn-helix domain-containing protein [Aquimarina sediminis]|uniref:helix-turn-helix domain-containing protein n=1 Tax=Aquimarina sediminis TaxID=2070536 RepID=UPI000CA043C1|nr:helix-turn-helix transcriptional regulator [Aquimarina sediminis]
MIKQDKLHRIKLIGERVKELRINSGYTSYETFAVDKGLDRKHYWRLEKGSNFTLSTLIRICDIHNISLKEFFKDIE